MSSAFSSSPICSFNSPAKPRLIGGNPNAQKVIFLTNQKSKLERFQALEVKATNGPETGTKTRSIVCGDCEGNGAKQCTQCQGQGVNLEDHFDGRFKAGGLCWLCRGKREILCGNCNGAGFMGGFMSTADQ